MVIWATGNSKSGKTTLARQMKTDRTILLDGDEIRNWTDNRDLSQKGRWEHNLRVARMAKTFEKQGFDVIVSLICPYKKLRDEVHEICNCSFIYLKGGKKGKEYPYEYEDDKYYFKKS